MENNFVFLKVPGISGATGPEGGGKGGGASRCDGVKCLRQTWCRRPGRAWHLCTGCGAGLWDDAGIEISRLIDNALGPCRTP